MIVSMIICECYYLPAANVKEMQGNRCICCWTITDVFKVKVKPKNEYIPFVKIKMKKKKSKQQPYINVRLRLAFYVQQNRMHYRSCCHSGSSRLPIRYYYLFLNNVVNLNPISVLRSQLTPSCSSLAASHKFSEV